MHNSIHIQLTQEDLLADFEAIRWDDYNKTQKI